MPPCPDISAVILAAGFSRRMGSFKPLMDLGGQTLLDRVVSLYRNAGVADIRVVTGFRSQAVRCAAASQAVRVIHNPAHDQGMFSSVKAGVASLAPDVRFFFVHPVDIALVRPHTIDRTMAAAGGRAPSVVYPCFDGRRGHPPLVQGRLRNAILDHDGQGGLRGLLERFDATARQIQVADEGVLLDLDTPDDVQRLSRRLQTAHCLNEKECRVLMEKVHGLPRPLIDHCRRVARVARVLAEAVNHNGGALDAPLVEAAARVHDVARLEKNHADAGARLLREMGFPAMAAVVAVHMDIRSPAAAPVDEAQIVYLADKMVEGDAVMDLRQRFGEKLSRQPGDRHAAASILRRWRAARTIQDKVASASGVPLDRLLEGAGVTPREAADKDPTHEPRPAPHQPNEGR